MRAFFLFKKCFSFILLPSNLPSFFFLSFTDGVVRPMIFNFYYYYFCPLQNKNTCAIFFSFQNFIPTNFYLFFFKKRKMFVLEHWWILSLCLPVFLKQGEKYYFGCHYGFIVFLLKLKNKYDSKYFDYSFLCREIF